MKNARKNISRRKPPPFVLIFSATDGSGGAGALADSRAIYQSGGKPLVVQTALTAQNLDGVLACWHTPPAHIRQQFFAFVQNGETRNGKTINAKQSDSVSDIKQSGVKISAIKVGVISAPAAKTIAECVRILSSNSQTPPPLVWDPVLSPTAGAVFTDNKAVAKCARYLIPIAEVITPNRAECLTLAAAINPAFSKSKRKSTEAAAEILLKSGAKRVLVTDIKKGAQVCHAMYALADEKMDGKIKTTWQATCRRRSGNFHGTGCLLSSTLAAHLANGNTPEKAAAHAHSVTLKAIDQAQQYPKLGKQWMLG